MTAKQKQISEEIKNKLILEVESSDTESAHSNADDLLCELLIKLGFKEVVDIYEQVGKWYS